MNILGAVQNWNQQELNSKECKGTTVVVRKWRGDINVQRNSIEEKRTALNGTHK
jgi:hypothetical protein